MKKVELLAPAGNMEAFISAINAGADAVYIGGDKFSARAFAGNFDIENMKKAIDYAHIRDAKVYVTINTLIKERELKEAKAYIKDLYSIGVDALIVQDTGIAMYIKKAFPDFELHASTQMTAHNGEGAKYLANKGFKRIVLSRELSLEEIRYISTELKIETEIFVHGALCVSYSGQCLMSSMIGGRSGNRGRCAQACRMPYTLINKDSNDTREGFLLSPKDLCTIDFIKEVIETGTASLKIEGRMKRPEYVAGVVKNYREALEIIEGNKEGKINSKESYEELLQLFNREGFNKAYFYGNPGIELMAINNPKNTGVLIGTVGKDMHISLSTDIEIKDGISNGSGGFTLSKIAKKGETVEKAIKGDRVRLYPVEYKIGDKLYKTSSESLTKKYSPYKSESIKSPEALSLEYSFKKDEPFTLTGTYKGRFYKVQGDKVQEAINRPISRERLLECLYKIGDTPFNIKEIHELHYDEGFMPIASINKLRRELFDIIEKTIIEGHRRSFNELNYQREKRVKYDPLPKYLISINTKDQLKAFLSEDYESCIVNLFSRKDSINEADLESLEGKEVYLKAPNIIKKEFPRVSMIIERNLSKIKGIVTSNQGIIEYFKGKTDIIGDYKLNIFNSLSTDFYEEDLKGVTLSLELNKKEIADIASKSLLPLQVISYGKTEMMIMEYCPIGSIIGHKNSKENCSLECEKGSFVLKDRMNIEFPVITDRFCRCSLLNSLPLNIMDKEKELMDIGINSFRIDFTDESYEEALEVLKSLREQRSINEKNCTRGHYKRGVE